jgi:hypothetical protein
MAAGFGGIENVFKRGPVLQFPLDKLNSFRQQIAASMAQIVKNDSAVPVLGKQGRHSSTDVPGTAGNQNLHQKDVLS